MLVKFGFVIPYFSVRIQVGWGVIGLMGND